MQPADIGALVAAGTPRVSPDGATVAFVVTRVDGEENRYRGQIWLVPADGSRPAEPFTSGDDRDASPVWSPDGRRLAYTSTNSVGETALRVAPMASGGETVTIARFDEGVDDLVWSPDGQRLAFTSRVRDPSYEITDPKRRPPRRITHFFSRLDDVGWIHDRPKHVHVVAADGSTRPLDVTPGERQFWGPSWSPDGTTLVFAGAAHDTWDLDFVTDLFTWTASAGVERADRRRAPTTIRRGHPTAPSSPCSATTTRPRSPRTPGSASSSPPAARCGGSAPRSTGTWPRSAGRGHRSGTATAYWPPPTTAATSTCTASTPPGRRRPALMVGEARCALDHDLVGGTLAFAATAADRPAEIFTVKGGQERQVSAAADAFVARARPVPAEQFTAPSTGGVEVDVWVYLPPGFDPARRYPALLNIHGGPFTQYGNRFFDEAQVQAAAGFVVVMANPRGSSGREESWGRAIVGPKVASDPGTSWGSVDYDDVMAAMDEALRRYPAIDPARTGVLGGSYGGYMTTWVVAHTDRFVAACSERAVNDMILEETAADIASGFRLNFGPTWYEDPEEYRRISPITYVQDIDTPLLILHSEDDLRCPIAGAEQLFVALRLLGKEVEFYRFPAEGHELSRSGSPVHRIQRAELILDWFRRHLQP